MRGETDEVMSDLGPPVSREVEREVIDMFGPAGNFEDYWLNYSPPDTRGDWYSAESVLKADRTRELMRESADSDSAASLLENGSPAHCTRHPLEMSPGERGGGSMGFDPEYTPVLEGILASGHRALAEQRRLERAARRRI
jgi:hypothetical protein